MAKNQVAGRLIVSVQYGSGCGRVFPAAEYFGGIYSAGWDYRGSYTIKGEERVKKRGGWHHSLLNFGSAANDIADLPSSVHGRYCFG